MSYISFTNLKNLPTFKPGLNTMYCDLQINKNPPSNTNTPTLTTYVNGIANQYGKYFCYSSPSSEYPTRVKVSTSGLYDPKFPNGSTPYNTKLPCTTDSTLHQPKNYQITIAKQPLVTYNCGDPV